MTTLSVSIIFLIQSVFGPSLSPILKNTKHERVPPIVYLQLTCFAKNLSVPFWVLRINYPKKLILLSTSFPNHKP